MHNNKQEIDQRPNLVICSSLETSLLTSSPPLEERKETNQEQDLVACLPEEALLADPHLEEGKEADQGLNLIVCLPEERALSTNPHLEIWSYCKATKRYVSLAVPFSMSRMADIVTELMAGGLLARYGHKYLAANALIIVIQRLFVGVGLGSLYSVGKLLADVNDDDNEKVSEVTRRGIVYGLLYSIPATGLVCASSPILKLFGQDPDVASIVQDFYEGAAISVPGLLMFATFQQFTLGIGRPNLALWINLLNNAMTLGIGTVLTFGYFGLPEWKAFGMGVGHSIAYSITLTGTGLYLCLNSTFRPYQLWKISFRDLKRRLGELVELGLPFGCQIGSDFFMQYIMMLMVGWLGTPQLSSARIAEMVFMPIFVFTTRAPQAVCVLTTEALKGRNIQNVKRVIQINVGLLSLWTVLWSVAAYAFEEPLMPLFIESGDPNRYQIMSFTKTLFWIYPIGLLGEIVRYGVGGVYRGFGNTKTSMWNSIFCLDVFGLPLLFLAYGLKTGMPGVYIARDIALVLGATSLSCQWSRIKHAFFNSDAKNQRPGIFTRAFNSVRGWMPCFFSNQGEKATAPSASAVIIEELPSDGRSLGV